MQREVVILYQCFDTNYRPVGCLETSARNDQYSVHDSRSAVLTKMFINRWATVRISKQIKLSSYQLDRIQVAKNMNILINNLAPWTTRIMRLAEQLSDCLEDFASWIPEFRHRLIHVEFILHKMSPQIAVHPSLSYHSRQWPGIPPGVKPYINKHCSGVSNIPHTLINMQVT